MTFFRIAIFIVIFLFSQSYLVFAHHGGRSAIRGSEVYDNNEGILSGAMINSPTASTLGRNRITAGFTFNYLRYNRLNAQVMHELHEEGQDVHINRHQENYDMYVGYGVMEDLDLYLVAPIVSKTSIQIEDEENVGRSERATGFGDMQLLAAYKFWKKYVEAAVIAGIQFPTGRTTAKDQSGQKFETELQPGTGAWDGVFGLVLSRSFKNQYSLATSFQYFLNTQGAQEYSFGDVFQYNIGASYAVRQLGKYPNLNLISEFNFEWSLHDQSRTQKKVNGSGGTTVVFTPGVNVNITPNVSCFWGMPLPIYHTEYENHSDLEYQMLTGINFYI